MTNKIDVNEMKLTPKDFKSDQDVRWCPGCGDYSILAQVQRVFPTLGIPKEQFVWVSGIGCSSRFHIIWIHTVFIQFMVEHRQLLPD